MSLFQSKLNGSGSGCGYIVFIISLVHLSILYVYPIFHSFNFVCFFLFTETAALRDVEVFVPAAVRRGETTRLHCMYDLEGDTLYAVKWYKGRREFYRYTPKENPAMKTFSVNGINVLVCMNKYRPLFFFIYARTLKHNNHFCIILFWTEFLRKLTLTIYIQSVVVCATERATATANPIKYCIEL